MKEGEQGAKSASEEDYVISIADGAREGLLVGVQAKEDAIEERRGIFLCFEVAIKFEELWKKREDECEGYLGPISKLTLFGKCEHTRSSNKEIKITRKICFRLAGDTGGADIGR